MNNRATQKVDSLGFQYSCRQQRKQLVRGKSNSSQKTNKKIKTKPENCLVRKPHLDSFLQEQKFRPRPLERLSQVWSISGCPGSGQAEVISMGPGSSGLLTHIIDFILSWTPWGPPNRSRDEPTGKPTRSRCLLWGVGPALHPGPACVPTSWLRLPRWEGKVAAGAWATRWQERIQAGFHSHRGGG